MTTLLDTKAVKARKSHQCFACLLTIERGELHTVESYVDDGAPYRIRLHTECQAECEAISLREPEGFYWPETAYFEGSMANDLTEAHGDQITGTEWQRWYWQRKTGVTP